MTFVMNYICLLNKGLLSRWIILLVADLDLRDAKFIDCNLSPSIRSWLVFHSYKRLFYSSNLASQHQIRCLDWFLRLFQSIITDIMSCETIWMACKSEYIDHYNHDWFIHLTAFENPDYSLHLAKRSGLIWKMCLGWAPFNAP